MQRPHQGIGEFFCDFVGDGVHEGQQRTHGCALAVVDGRALGTTAIRRTVVLADGNVLHTRVRAEIFEDALRRDAEHVGIGQTELRLRAVVCHLPEALAVHHRVVFGMFLSEFTGRHEEAERVVDVLQRGFSPQSRVRGHRVGAVARGEFGILICFCVETPTKRQRRMIEPIHGTGHAPVSDRRHVDVVVGQEPHAEVILEKRVDSVKRPSRAAACDGDRAVADDDAQVLLTESRDVETGRTLEHCRTGANKDAGRGVTGRAGLGRFRSYRQSRRPGLLEEMLQLVRCVYLAGNCVGGNDNSPIVQRCEIYPLRRRAKSNNDGQHGRKRSSYQSCSPWFKHESPCSHSRGLRLF